MEFNKFSNLHNEKKDDPKFNNIQLIKPIEYIKPITISEIKLSNPGTKQFALYPILPVQGIAFIYAASGLGKTMFTLNLAYAIAGGGNFLKYKSPEPRKVLYIDGEMAYIDIYNRLMQIIKQQGELDFAENFLIYTPDKMKMETSSKLLKMPKICSKEGQTFYNEAIEKNNIDVIVFDNLSMLSTIDESSAEEWYIINDWLLHLRSIGKTSIVVHHAGKDVTGYRGTSRMLDSVNTAISLQQVEILQKENEQPDYSKKFKIVYQKHRDFFGADAESYEVTFLNEKWSHTSIELSMLDKVIDCANSNMSQREIAKELFISQPKVHRLIKEAKRLGKIKD